jgi:phosphoribosylformylglycinamidine synthase I
MNIGVVTFPGSNCDVDTVEALHDVGVSAISVWYRDTDVAGLDGVILPGGFSYGDYLRSGALAAKAPIMNAVRTAALERQLPVLGICNGFQLLTEAGMLPGALRPNRHGEFRCSWETVRVSASSPSFPGLRPGQTLRLPIAHAEGAYYLPPGALEDLFSQGQVWLQYVDGRGDLSPLVNPNGSVANIAGVIQGSVAGLMPHPERAMARETGSSDGRRLLEAWVEAVAGRMADAR